MSNQEENSYEENEDEEQDDPEDDEENFDYKSPINNNDEKFKKFTEIASKKGDFVAKPITNAHYDMEFVMNKLVDTNTEGNDEDSNTGRRHIDLNHQHNIDKLRQEEEEDSEESQEYIPNNRGSELNDDNKYTKLPKFDMNEFIKLNVNPEVKELMNILMRFQPNEYFLDTKLKPYIPSYIPTIGEVDAFIKMNRPDNLPEELGLSVLDEPTISGIDPSIFSLELSYKLKSKSNQNYIIKSIENAENNRNKIQNWVDQINILHKEKMSSHISYSKQMPNLETLMQIWPEKIESVLDQINFPDENLNINIENYSKIVCNMVDIPIHNTNTKKGTVEALHVLFTLYSEFKENQHFQRGNNIKEDNVQSMKF